MKNDRTLKSSSCNDFAEVGVSNTVSAVEVVTRKYSGRTNETVVFTELSAQGSCFSNKSFVDIPYLLRLNSKFKHIKVKSKGTYLTSLGKGEKKFRLFCF